MFYIEVQVKKSGHVAIVKLAHCGESPTICRELLLLLRNKDFEGFGKSLEGLLHLYNIPGNSDVKAKVYHSLCSLEEDMRALFNLNRPKKKEDKRTTILQGKVGFLSPRSGGTPMNIEYYISPSRDMEENPGVHLVVSNVSVTVAGTTNYYHLPVAPLFKEILQEGGSTYEFSSLTEESSMELPACFFLRLDTPEPVLLSLIQKIQNLSGLAVISTREGPLHELLILRRHKCLTAVIQQEIQFVVSLSDSPKHCYVMNSQLENENAMIGALVNKIPFIHPSHVPSILEVLRHQAAYNTLLNSCISNTINPRDSTSMLHFEVSLQSEYKICIAFQHPNGDSLSCVIVDVLSCRTLTCSNYTSPSDLPSPYSNELIVKDLQSCMSIPLTMRTIFKKTQEANLSEDVEMHPAEGNSVLTPVCSEDPKEAVIEQPSIAQDAQSICEENISQNDVYNDTGAILSDLGHGDVHSADVQESSPCQSQDPSSSYTEDPSFCAEEINSSVVEEHNSSVPEESSGLVEASSSIIVQEELSPIIAEVSSSITAEEQSSSNTEELSSSVIEELNLSMIEDTPLGKE
ncbi:mediator of RNA polymerase II transcription subunit 1-like [Eleutherodactylus coqui]|uniref:mediator of RNA polymerase II transcription subunit 1-like n=1 Tax=Eleutherodactylus coqui TaxID=57060 RepID=UPI003461B410